MGILCFVAVGLLMLSSRYRRFIPETYENFTSEGIPPPEERGHEPPFLTEDEEESPVPEERGHEPPFLTEEESPVPEERGHEPPFLTEEESPPVPEELLTSEESPSKSASSITVAQTNRCGQKSKKESPEGSQEWYYEPNPAILSPYGFTFMPNTLWSVPQQRPPVCAKTNKCEVCPVFTSGVPVDALTYTGVGSIMPSFNYKEGNGIPPKELQKMADKKVYNPNYFYNGYYAKPSDEYTLSSESV
jgi:hypothetical protein